MKNILLYVCGMIVILTSCAVNEKHFDEIKFGGAIFKTPEYGCRWIQRIQNDDWISMVECGVGRKFISDPPMRTREDEDEEDEDEDEENENS